MFRHKDSDNKWREEKNKLVESLRNEVSTENQGTLNQVHEVSLFRQLQVDRIRKMAKEREAKLNDEVSSVFAVKAENAGRHHCFVVAVAQIASLKSALTHAQGGERATTEQFEKLRNDLRHAQMLNRRYEKSIQQVCHCSMSPSAWPFPQ